jgi:acrylyl-CoA reductase (NADPH)
VGIDSVHETQERRALAWSRLARDLDPNMLDSMIQEVGLDQVEKVASDIVDGRVRGRVVVDVGR